MTSARVAETEICDTQACYTGHFLVRGDHISFVSLEQIKRVGEHKLDPRRMPSDVRLPASYVLVHDATGQLLSKCDLYVVKWHRGGADPVPKMQQNELAVARDYFGQNARIMGGRVDIPQGKWVRGDRIRYIRYRRYGFDTPFEHRYDMPVYLYTTKRPFAVRIALPEGCVIDSRGFVRP